MRRYKRNYNQDPYETTARFNSTCPTCQKQIVKGNPIIIWDRKGHHEECLRKDYQRFREEKFDCEVLTNYSL